MKILIKVLVLLKNENILDINELKIFKIIINEENRKLKNCLDFKEFSKSYIISYSNIILNSKIKKDKLNIIQNKKYLFLEINLILIKKNLINKIIINYTNDLDYSSYLNKKLENFEEIGNKINLNSECLIGNNISFLIQNLNPYYFKYDLANIKIDSWIKQMKSALLIIKNISPKIYDYIIPFLDSISPNGFYPKKQVSISFLTSPGIIYLSYLENDIFQAEAIIHELHHTILSLTYSYDLILLNPLGELNYYSPYQEIPRSLALCFVALHAFIAILNFYKDLIKKLNSDNLKELEIYLEKYFKTYIKTNTLIITISKYAKFTSNGLVLFNFQKINHKNNKTFFEIQKEKFPGIFKKIQLECNNNLIQIKKKYPEILV